MVYQFFHGIDNLVILWVSCIYARTTMGITYSLGTSFYLTSFILGVAFLRTKKQRPSSGYNLIRDSVLIIYACICVLTYLFYDKKLRTGIFLGIGMLFFLILEFNDKKINDLVRLKSSYIRRINKLL